MIEVRAQAALWRNGVEFLIQEEMKNGLVAYAGPILMEASSDTTEFAPEPTFSLSYEKAQILMDDLWNSGLRPTEGTGSAGSLRATEKHLDDMRRILEKQLDVSLK